MVVVTSKKLVPKGLHWAIFKFSSIHIPGDERSRTNPGHGYPASDEPVVRYEAYSNKEEWEADVRRLEGLHRNDYLAVEVNPANITVQTIINVS